MDVHHINIYLDGRHAGHAYLELPTPEGEPGEVYGYYPARAGEKREVLFGRGQIRLDRGRLEDVKQGGVDVQIVKSVEVTTPGLAYLRTFLEKARKHPHFYLLLGYNCVDFIQDAYEAALGEGAGHFLCLYSEEELDRLGYVGLYGRVMR